MANTFYYVEDLVSGGATNTVTDDGSGVDWLVLRDIHDSNEINLAWWIDAGVSTMGESIYFIGSTGSRLVVNGRIENARGANGADYIAGNEANNTLFGDALADGAGGNDTLFGGAGNDTIYGGRGDDAINGAGDNDRLFGNAGRDTISGGDGADTVEGGSGADSLSGGGNAGDCLSYASSGTGVRVSVTFGTTTTCLGGDAQGDQITGFVNVIGSDYNDVLTDTVTATIAFRYNANLFDGGAGNDRLTLGGGNDRGLGGTGNDTILGGEGNDRIEGNDGNDTLGGDAGLDMITAGLGSDRLTGGTGADRFIFVTVTDSSASGGIDTITDFSHAQHDRIDLSAIDANGTLAGDAAFNFLGTAAFTGAGAELRIVAVSTGWKVLADLDGDRSADFVLTLTGASLPALVAADFVL